MPQFQHLGNADWMLDSQGLLPLYPLSQPSATAKEIPLLLFSASLVVPFQSLVLVCPFVSDGPRAQSLVLLSVTSHTLGELIQSTYSSDSQMCIFSSNPSAEPQTYTHSYLFCSSIWMSNKPFTLLCPTLNSRPFPIPSHKHAALTRLPVSQLTTPPSFQLLKTGLHVTLDSHCPHSVHQIILLATRNPSRTLCNSPVQSLNTFISAALVQAPLFRT